VDVKYEPDDSDDDYEKKGYWGYMRDKKADRRQQKRCYSSNSLLNQTPSTATARRLNNNNSSNKSKNASPGLAQPSPPQPDKYDGYWGLFKDSHLDLSKASITPPAETKKSSRDEKSPKLFDLTFDSTEDSPSTASTLYTSSGAEVRHVAEAKLPKKIVYDYKRFKIEAQKRDE
jgi:hypothetical protein